LVMKKGAIPSSGDCPFYFSKDRVLDEDRAEYQGDGAQELDQHMK
jgi:hypothetical protein